MDLLGRFYTNNKISNLLVDNFESISPKKILDLGLGDASLSVAAYSKWKSAKYYGTEIEKHKVKALKESLSFIDVYNYDTLHPNTSKKLQIKFGQIDIAICNPPYIKVEDKNQYRELFESIRCDAFNSLKRVTSEIVFFAHNIKLLKKSGELGIIVSDSLITGKDFEIFRKTILKEFNVRRIIQLPDKVFRRTEARTHIIFISKVKSKTDYCSLFLSSLSGSLSEGVIVNKDDLINRMDFQFYKASQNSQKYFKTLKDIDVVIKRGKFSYKELREGNLQYFHSTHYKTTNDFIESNEILEDDLKRFAAKPGDILMCRVGKRIVGNCLLLKKGQILHSDCIYRISVPIEYREKLLDSFNSSFGKKWLKAYAHGVCSQVISKSDLENYPLTFL